MSEEAAPFLAKPVARWRAQARDWHRRPMLVKQLMLFSAAALIALPLLYMLSAQSDAATEYGVFYPDPHRVDVPLAPPISAVIVPAEKPAHDAPHHGRVLGQVLDDPPVVSGGGVGGGHGGSWRAGWVMSPRPAA